MHKFIAVDRQQPSTSSGSQEIIPCNKQANNRDENTENSTVENDFEKAGLE